MASLLFLVQTRQTLLTQLMLLRPLEIMLALDLSTTLFLIPLQLKSHVTRAVILLISLPRLLPFFHFIILPLQIMLLSLSLPPNLHVHEPKYLLCDLISVKLMTFVAACRLTDIVLFALQFLLQRLRIHHLWLLHLGTITNGLKL